MSETALHESDSPTNRVGRQLIECLWPFVALTLVTLFFSVSDWLINGKQAQFTTPQNFRTITAQTAIVGVTALGMTIVIISGGIDLSVGMAIALCATVMAWSLREDLAVRIVNGENVEQARSRLKRVQKEVDRAKDDAEKIRLQNQLPVLQRRIDQAEAASRQWTRWTPWIALATTLGCGCLCGWFNGVLISYLKLVPFIVTLGTMQLYLGIAKLIASETTVRPDTATQIPKWSQEILSILPQAQWLGLPSGVWLTLLLALVLAAVLHFTVFGRYVFALGSNEATARLCGINVRWNKIAVYALSGLFVGVAGLFQFSRLSVGNPTSGAGLELKVIASVVIGGGSLNGGRGTVLGTLTGALIMQVIISGCTALGLTNPIQDIILGVIIVAAVAVDQLRHRKERSA